MVEIPEIRALLANSPPEYKALAALAVVGVFSLVGTLSRLCTWLWRYFLRPGKNLSRYGSWAVVTGCTDGIGKGFCFQLAKRRLNLILIGRSQEKLESLTSELKAKYKSVQVRTVLLDFTHSDLSSGFAQIEQLLSELDVGILVNNAGLSYPYARFFHEVDAELTANILRVNVEVIVRMVQIILPHMLKRKHGAIVNIGSGSASVLPSDPLYALYAGTKGFIDKFSRNLYVEYKHSGIDVQCQAPLHVATKLASIRRSSFFCPSPDTYARSAVKWIGYEPLCTPYWPHSLLWKLVNLIPHSLVDTVRFQSCMDVRKRGKAKEARKKDQ
ncbi:hypothetical protein GOP47_0017485 [Adiantum capillus-veneris]|uniref:Uncharacterized protein n=1 Tax=Adiantum capillus-veneris TaxID=13818 RepID=A0A9D4UFX4_ADICA|nr:hypothetical protein GOP47_0017485 [Adiantum capillus-veneris]